MENILRELKNNDGLTLKGYKPINFKSGYQVADNGVICDTIHEAVAAIKSFNGHCGVWLSEGKWYIDHSFRVATKSKAMEIARNNNQQSILRWADKSLVWV